MDLLARLIAGASAAPNKHKLNTPGERLQTTIKICNNLRLLWQKGTVGPEDDAATARTTDLLTRLNSILLEESRKAAPHSCLLHIATSQIYIIITKLALQSQDNGVIRIASQLYHVLLNGEAEGLLDNKLFSRSILDLVRYSVIGPRAVIDEATETSLIELLFSICTKIRLDPDILPAWFHPERDRSQARTLQGESRRSQFPLFYVLVQYVHHDGSVGDFARTGLLYLTETAGTSKSLETWMIESDLAPQMASGLGALYSRLSRHFPPLEATEKALPILALSDLPETNGPPRETRSTFQQNMREFLAYLAFWQDTLNHCKSGEVFDTLLDHFQVLFVQQLLYPSLLESSDVEGGSTAAVIAHLTRIMLALDHPELSRRMLSYLLASNATRMPADHPRKHRPRLSISRRKSLDHLAALAEAAQTPSPDLFNLLDLILMSLKSKHVNTVNGSLKLLSVIINKQHQYALNGLFRADRVDDQALESVESFTNTLVQYFDIASTISSTDQAMDDSYQSTLTDIKDHLGQHSCMQDLQNHEAPTISLTINRSCKLLDALLNLLASFFSNSTLQNLLLTAVLLSLASCDRIALHGWLISDTAAEESEASRSVTTVLEELVGQVRDWRDQFQQWETLILQRRYDLSADEQVIAPPASTVPTPIRASPNSQVVDGLNTPQRSRPATSRLASGSPTVPSIDGTLSASPSSKLKLFSQNIAGSPLKKSYFPQEVGTQDGSRSVSGISAASEFDDLLKTQLRIRQHDHAQSNLQSISALTRGLQLEGSASTNASTLVTNEDPGSGIATPNAQVEDAPDRSHASLNHILTNAIILQEFVLEIAAVIQVRGTMFGEVDLKG